MQRLRSTDLEGVIRVASEIAALDADPSPFPRRLLESLMSLVGSERASYVELDRVDERVLAVEEAGDGPEEANDATFWSLRHEWPSCSYEDRTLDFSAHKESDFVSMRELRRLRIYNEWLRPAGVEYQIAVGLPAPLTHTKLFMFDNGPGRVDFGERERSILTLLRPHLVQRYERVEAQRRVDAALAAVDETGEPLVLLGDDGRPYFVTVRARRLLASYGLDEADVPNVRPLSLRTVRPNVLLLEERNPLGLTPRERQVLELVAEGNTNAQIAGLLWIAPGTVAKHLENAYAKLGVTSRTAAVRMMRANGGR